MAGSDPRTIGSFGEQWAEDPSNEGYYGSHELFLDIVSPVLEPEELQGARVAEIGSGAGRVVRMLLEAGVRHVTALEPSSGVEALRANTREVPAQVEILKATGEALPAGLDLDFVFAIGVLPFVPDPGPLLRAARGSLREGGRIVVWTYAREGTASYRLCLAPLRALAARLPRALFGALCEALTVLLDIYIFLCRWLPLPLRSYLLGTLARVSRDKRRLTICDQLHPSYVHFHSRGELESLLREAGFGQLRLRYRRGYSWTASGTKDTLGRRGEEPS